MNAGWKVSWVSLAVFGATFGAERLFRPHIVPIAFAEEPRPGCAVQLAFLLRTVELMTAVLAIVLLLGTWARGRPPRRALPRAAVWRP